MARVTLIEFDGRRHTINAQNGRSLMEEALNNGIDGIVGECGGACACATCHVYVDASWRDAVEVAVGKANEIEQAMLDWTDAPKPESRLSCQIKISDALDGLVVGLPETQG